MKRRVMCTSTGCIDYAPERYRALGIEIIRIHVFFEGREYREGLDLNPDEFYARLETIEDPKNNLPHTGMPDTEEILGAFDRAVDDGFDEIIVFNSLSQKDFDSIASLMLNDLKKALAERDYSFLLDDFRLVMGFVYE